MERTRFTGFSRLAIQLALAVSAGLAGMTSAFASDPGSQCVPTADMLAQAAAIAEQHRQEIFREVGRAEVPWHLKRDFERLVAAAGLDPKKVSLVGMHHRQPIAFATVDGQILLSSATWGPGSIFTDDEVLAILAHEVAHVKHGHQAHAVCLAFALAGSNSGSVEEVVNALKDRMKHDKALEEMVRQANHRREFEADVSARELLVRVGLDEGAMQRALSRLGVVLPHAESLSHPEVSARAAKAAPLRQ